MTRTESSPFKGATDGTHTEDLITIKSTSTKIPQGLEAEILKYLKFEDLKHGNVLEGNSLFREESIYEFMEETNFDEPIRHIFKDFDNAALVDDDGLRLEYLKALMKNNNFGHYLENRKLIMTLVYSYPLMIHRVVDEDFCNGFLNWLMFQREDSPEKEFILANRTDLYSLLSRGSHTNDPNQGYLYHNLLPPELGDTVKQLIKRGDQHAADLFDQLMSNAIISDWFSHDHRHGGFDQSIHETIKAGQTKVFFKDSIFGILRSDDHSELAANCVRNDRVDILNECLTKLQGLEQYTFYVSTVREITKLASEENDPGYVIKLAKDLITENLQLVRTSPIVVYDLVGSIPNYPSELRLELLNHILRSETNPQLTSLLEFMLAEYQLAGIDIEREEALERAALYRNHEYDQFFLDNLPD